MGRGLFYLVVAGAAAAWSLYSHFRDDDPEEPPPSRPRSPSPSRRRDARKTMSSRVNYPPVESFGRPRSPPSRWRDDWGVDDPPAENFHPRPSSPNPPFDDWGGLNSSRAKYPPVRTYASLSPPRSPSPHDWEDNDPPLNIYDQPSPSPDHHCCQFDDWGSLDPSQAEYSPAQTYSSLSPPRSPSPHDWEDNDPPLNIYDPPSPSPDHHCCQFDDWGPLDPSQAEYSPAQTYSSLSHPRSPSPDDWQTDDARSPSPDHPCYQFDDWGALDSPQAEYSPVQTHASLSPSPHDWLADDPAEIYHPQSPSLDSPCIHCGRFDDWGALDPPAKTHASLNHLLSHSPHDWQDDDPAEIYHHQSPSLDSPCIHCGRFDDWGALDSPGVEEPLANTHASLSHSRSPSPHIPSRQLDDEQTADSFEVESPPLETYTTLRDRAREEDNLRSECIRESEEAYDRGDHALAMAYSDQAEYHACMMEGLNVQASTMVFKENNKNRRAGEFDLHGLYVREAISYTEIILAEARQQGDSEICLIVGRGKHADGGIARLKPAIRQFLRKRAVRVREYPSNPGRLRLVL